MDPTTSAEMLLSSDRLMSIHYYLSWECKEQLDQALVHGTGLERMGDNCVGEVRDAIEGKGRSKERQGSGSGAALDGEGRRSKVVGTGGILVVLLFLAVLVLIMAVVLKGGRGGKGRGAKGGKKGDKERVSPTKKGSAKKGKKKGG